MRKNTSNNVLQYKYDKDITTAPDWRSIFLKCMGKAEDNTTSHSWFRKYRDVNRWCKNHTRSRRPSVVSDEDPDTAIKNYQHSPIEELVETFSRHRISVERWMQALDFITITTVTTFLKKKKTNSFSWWWQILHRNVKHRITVCRVAEDIP